MNGINYQIGNYIRLQVSSGGNYLLKIFQIYSKYLRLVQILDLFKICIEFSYIFQPTRFMIAKIYFLNFL